MATSFVKKYDYNPNITREVVTGEEHIIPSTEPYEIFLIHIPRKENPSTVIIPGFTETEDPPEPGEFLVHYGEEGAGRIEFNAADAGKTVSVSYHACGTVVWAEREGINKIQDAIVAAETTLTQHVNNNDIHVLADYRAAMDNAKVRPSATNPFVTEESLNDAMTGSAKPGVQSLADLAAIPPDQRADKDTRLVEDEGKIYRFDADATEGDVKPLEGSGYWILVSAATQHHNNMSGLQGGGPEEYYHFTQTEHDSLLAHLTDKNNPHGITPAQIGAYAVGSKVADSDKLDGQDGSYYTDIPARLGYTPVNRAGDTMTGNLTVNAVASAYVFKQNGDGVPRSNLGNPSLMEMAIIDAEYTNKLWFYQPSLFEFEYTMDGETWVTQEVSESTIKKLVSGRSNASITIPRDCKQYRITIHNDGKHVYVNAVYMYCSTNGNKMSIQVQKKKNSDTSWTDVATSTQTVSCWPGHVFLLLPGHIAWSQSSNSSHYHQIRLIFTPQWTHESNAITLQGLELWGGYPAGKRTIYDWDENQNVIFPAGVTVNDRLKVNGLIEAGEGGIKFSDGTVQQTSAQSTIILDTFTGDGSTKVFTLSGNYIPGRNFLNVFVDGVRQVCGKHYTESSNNTITFTEAPKNGATIEVYWFGDIKVTAIGSGEFLTIHSTGNTFLATSSGNVGIGTTGPSAKLHVDGDVKFTGQLLQGTVPWARLSGVPSPTITLTGDVTGSGTLTNLGSVSITTTVANDSHTHDSRYYTESEADSRFVNVSGDTMTGYLTFGITASTASPGIRWSGASDIHSIFVEEYGGSESTRLIIQNADNGNTDYTLFQAKSGSTIKDLLEVRYDYLNALVPIRINGTEIFNTSGQMTGGTVPWARLSGVPSASTSTAGIVQLSSSTSSTSTTLAATASAVKAAYDLANTANTTANAALPKAGGTMTGAIQFNDANTKILEGSSNALRIQTNNGYIDLGPQNTTYCHIYTDRTYFAFNKTINLDAVDSARLVLPVGADQWAT